MVVKLGGAAIDAELDRALAQDVLLLRSVGVRCVLVHGGGPQVDAVMKKMGKEPEFSDGLRVTDAETLRDRAHGAGRRGQPRPRRDDQPRDRATIRSRSALRARMAACSPPPRAMPALGFVGDVAHVRAERLHGLLDQGLVPVVSTVGADPSGQPYNINADEAAMAIAVAMKAEKIVYLTAAPGLLEDAEGRDARSSPASPPPSFASGSPMKA